MKQSQNKRIKLFKNDNCLSTTDLQILQLPFKIENIQFSIQTFPHDFLV